MLFKSTTPVVRDFSIDRLPFDDSFNSVQSQFTNLAGFNESKDSTLFELICSFFNLSRSSAGMT